jgi:uncharacterized membrane protein HdeD (DUF308 family)
MFSQDGPVIAIAVGANAVIGGALASVYYMDQRSEYRANWWADYGILGVLLGLCIGPLMAIGISAMLIAIGVVEAVQGIALILLLARPGRING